MVSSFFHHPNNHSTCSTFRPLPQELQKLPQSCGRIGWKGVGLQTRIFSSMSFEFLFRCRIKNPIRYPFFSQCREQRSNKSQYWPRGAPIPPKRKRRNGPTDGLINGRTDRPFYRHLEHQWTNLTATNQLDQRHMNKTGYMAKNAPRTSTHALGRRRSARTYGRTHSGFKFYEIDAFYS